MGGLAFASGPDALFTPRMPKHIYLQVKAQCYEILRGLYEVVESPIDGPGKTDFGDIDILVHGPKPLTVTSNKAEALKQVSEALGATRMKFENSDGVSSHVAIPWPEMPTGSQSTATAHHQYGAVAGATETTEQPPAADSLTDNITAHPQLNQRLGPEQDPEDDDGGQIEPKDKHIQIDIAIYDDIDKLRWLLFKHAHGDIWNLIGSTIRPYGLTVDQQAMWLRVPEIEKSNKQRAKVKLTADRSEILRFLDLPTVPYWQGAFEDVDSMYEYVAQCRMFRVRPESSYTHEDSQALESGAVTEEAERAALKSNDRRRMNYRPAYRKWLEEYKPQCRRDGRYLEQRTTREQITAEALAEFHVEEEYERRRREFLAEKQREYIWTEMIKKPIPQADPSIPREITYRSCQVKALKRIILEDDERYAIRRPDDLKGEDGLFIIDRVASYIEMHKDEIGKIAYDNHIAKYLVKKANDVEKISQANTDAVEDVDAADGSAKTV